MINNYCGRLFIISGPSGAGKGTLVKQLIESRPQLRLSVSATTRPKRSNEHEGKDYRFLSDSEFMDAKRVGMFLESALVHGHHYGTIKTEVERLMDEGCSVILEIDVQGAKQVKISSADAVYIFVTVPDLQELEKRLTGRQTERKSDIAVRIENAKDEMAEAEWFDYVVVNDDLEKAVNELIGIVDKETAGF